MNEDSDISPVAAMLINKTPTNTVPSGIVKYIFNANLPTLELICMYLRKSPRGTAHPCSKDGQRYLLVWNGVCIERHDMNLVDPNIFLSTAKLSDLVELIANHIRRFDDLMQFNRFTVQLLNPGEVFDLPIRQEIMVYAVTEKKDGNFFDLAVYFEGNNQALTYNRRNVDGVTHSGDIGGLLHHVKRLDMVTDWKAMVIAVTGFRKRKLRYFGDQLPCVVFVDHEKETNFVVPCPLDPATIGEASMSGLVVAWKHGNFLRCSVLSSPMTVDDVDTGEMNQQVLAAIDRAVQQGKALSVQADVRMNQPAVEEIQSLVDSASFTFEQATQALSVSNQDDFDFLHFVQSGTKYQVNTEKSFFFGLGFTRIPNEDLSTVLPHVFGEVAGVAACALGRLPITDIPIEKLIHQLPSIVEVDDDSWKDSVVPSCNFSGNCIMIVHPGTIIQNAFLKLSSDDKQFQKNLEEIMNGICVNASCMAGPNAIVVVKLGSRIFWYRGVRYMGLVNKVPNYCSDVTEFFTQDAIDKWLSSKPQFPWPLVVKRDAEKLVHWNGIMMPFGDALSQLSRMTLEDLSANTESVVDLLTQISVVFEPNEVRAIRTKIDLFLNEMLMRHLEPFRKECYQAVCSLYEGNGDALKPSREMYASVTAEKRRANKLLQRISDSLHNLVSRRGVSNNHQSIKMRIREATIANNVADAKSMSIDDRAKFMVDNCSECGILMAVVDSTDVGHCLRAVGASQFCSFIEAGTWSHRLAAPDERMGQIDSLTVGCLMEICVGQKEHPLYGDNSFALPRGLHDEAMYISLMPFLMLDWAINLKDPCQVDWVEMTNNPKFALSRVWIRNTFSNCSASREFNINPQSNDLGFFIMHMILCVMENIVEVMMNVPDMTKDWDNTTCQMMRGMMCQLLATAASTKTILCPVFKMLHKNATLEILPKNQWWVLSRMLRLFPYTCWDSTIIVENVRRYIIKSIQKYLTNEPCQKMAKMTKSFEKVQKVKSPEWLAFLRLLVDVLFYYGGQMLLNGTKMTPIVANRLLSFQTSDLSTGTSMILDQVRKLVGFVESVAMGNADWDEGFFTALQIAAFSYIKHSNNIEGSKKEIRPGVHACVNLNDIVSLYQDIRLENMIPKWASSDDPNHETNFHTILYGDEEAHFLPNTQLVEQQITRSQLLSSLGTHFSFDLDVVVPTAGTLPMILNEFPGSSDAVALAASIPELTCGSLAEVPHKDLAFIFEFVGVNDHDTAFREIIRSLLLLWRDPVNAEVKTIDAVFKG